MLTSDSVSILTQKFIEIDEEEQQVGENHRRAYVNSIQGRKELLENEPEGVNAAVMAMWGDEPTVIQHESNSEENKITTQEAEK